MGGIVGVLMVLILIMIVALLFGVVTMHQEIERIFASSKRMHASITEDQNALAARIAECEELEANMGRSMMLTDDDVHAIAKGVHDLRGQVADLKKRTHGYTDETEYQRLRTQAFITLPNQVAKLDAIVTGRPYVARIEKQDGLIGMRYVVDEEIAENYGEEESHGKAEGA